MFLLSVSDPKAWRAAWHIHCSGTRAIEAPMNGDRIDKCHFFVKFTITCHKTDKLSVNLSSKLKVVTMNFQKLQANTLQTKKYRALCLDAVSLAASLSNG